MFFKVFKKIITNSCIYYTFLITAFYTFGLLAEDSTGWIPTLRIAYSLLGFSVGFSALNAFTARMKTGFAAKFFLHFPVTAVLYYLIFVLGGGFRENGGTTLAAMIVFAFLYAVGTVIVLIVRRLLSPKGTETQNGDGTRYTSMFQK